MKRSTAMDRFRRAIARVTEWCRRHRHDDVRAQQHTLVKKLKGHYEYYEYYGITGHSRALARFFHETKGAWRQWLNRRSQRASMSWERMCRLLKRYPLPWPHIWHPFTERVANL